MKPPRLERHSFVCKYCNRKRVGDRPQDYREDWHWSTELPRWWWRWWGNSHKHKWWWRWFARRRAYHSGFYHVACQRARAIEWRLLH